jgi:hypothetical protein
MRLPFGPTRGGWAHAYGTLRAMEGASSRRGFLRALISESARTAQEASRVLNNAQKPPRPPAPVPPERTGPQLQRARAAARTVTFEELEELAVEHGLQERLVELRELARHSIRLTSPTLDDPAVGSWLVDPAAGLLDEDTWPIWSGERLTLVAQLDLGDPALRDVDLPLPPDGRLLFLFAALQAPAGDMVDHEGAGRVLHVPAPFGPAPVARLSVELTLPRVWSAPVQRLALDPIEHDGYLRLRRRVASLQDVELDDNFGDPIAYHRALGYPNETTGLMPTTCELVSTGQDGGQAGTTADDDVGARAARWRLLLQLTVAVDGPWNLGGEGGRLYFWITEDDLRAHDFSRVRAIAQPGVF